MASIEILWEVIKLQFGQAIKFFDTRLKKIQKNSIKLIRIYSLIFV